MRTAIETVDLHKMFGGRPVLRGVNLSVPAGSIHGVIGANGAGKSTLLRILMGLYRPSRGQVRVLGEVMDTEATELRQRVHLVASEGDLPRGMRVRDYLHYHRLLYRTWDETRCRRLLEALELPEGAPLRNLSQGMRTQLRLTVALSAHPEVLLLDEPTNGLDPVVKRQFLQLLLQEASGTGATIVIATHHLDDLERIADSVTILFSGRALASGQLDHLRDTVKRVQAVLAGELPESIVHHPAVVEVQRSGRMVLITVSGNVQAVVTALGEAGATYCEVVDLELEELFRHFMEREGYRREGILLP
ncbi:ABC transporter ATP-binding protein [Alicyclobacillus sp.]|uniref:ABC transporter ATP-binding protein n=1 Tax=Alicyclobacillus sp. TaxID=61169 RepID=UPI0025B8F3BF|nr:ABC transporter ATP-binding protein [Alicyclobacillus sp.]MCL6516397.1 ABC transporter ATP-binding protein [Alicyclobacillus sp.]